MIGIYDLDKCSSLDYKTRLNIYKNAGFEEIALYIDNNYLQPNETYDEIIKYAKKLSLKINQVHADYKISNVICDHKSNEYFDYMESKLNECKKYNIKYLVAHASMGNNPPELDEQSLKKLENMQRKIEKFQENDVAI